MRTQTHGQLGNLVTMVGRQKLPLSEKFTKSHEAKTNPKAKNRAQTNNRYFQTPDSLDAPSSSVAGPRLTVKAFPWQTSESAISSPWLVGTDNLLTRPFTVWPQTISSGPSHLFSHFSCNHTQRLTSNNPSNLPSFTCCLPLPERRPFQVPGRTLLVLQ